MEQARRKQGQGQGQGPEVRTSAPQTDEPVLELAREIYVRLVVGTQGKTPQELARLAYERARAFYDYRTPTES